MKRDVCRAMAKAGYPVVTIENGAHGEIVYPYIREIKVVYASPAERARGFPPERLAVVLADKCGYSSRKYRQSSSGFRRRTRRWKRFRKAGHSKRLKTCWTC